MLAPFGALALIIMAHTAAVNVETAPGGGEVLSLSFDGPAWTEIRFALRAPVDPPHRAGLGAVAAEVLARELRQTKQLAPTVRLTRTHQGLIVSFATPRTMAEAAAQTALRTLASIQPTDSAIRAAVLETQRKRERWAQTPPALAAMQLQRTLLGRGPELGAPESLETITGSEVRQFLKETIVQSHLSLVLTGDVRGLSTKGWPTILPSQTSSTARSVLPPRPAPAPLEIVVVDRPGLSRAYIQLGWRPRGVTVEALPTIAAEISGPNSSWQAPLLTLTRSATVAAEAEALQSMLHRIDTLANTAPSPQQWKTAQTHARARVALSLRDASRAADALARDRVDPSRALRSVLDERLLSLGEAPPKIELLFRTERAVAVIVTSMGSSLVARLAELQPEATIRVVAWDQP